MTTIYGIKSCDTCRSARSWLRQHDIEHKYHDIRDDGLSEEILGRWQEAAGWESLINKRSITWRKIPTVDRESLDSDSALQLILTYPTVMKRPVLETDNAVLIGFDESQFKAALQPVKTGT